MCVYPPDTRRVAAPSSINAVNLSSARTTKRFPSPRCASTTKIVRLRESTAETQPQLQPASLRLSAMISQYFPSGGLWFFCSLHSNDKISLAHEHAGDFKEWGMIRYWFGRARLVGIFTILPSLIHDGREKRLRFCVAAPSGIGLVMLP